MLHGRNAKPGSPGLHTEAEPDERLLILSSSGGVLSSSTWPVFYCSSYKFIFIISFCCSYYIGSTHDWDNRSNIFTSYYRFSLEIILYRQNPEIFLP